MKQKSKKGLSMVDWTLAKVELESDFSEEESLDTIDGLINIANEIRKLYKNDCSSKVYFRFSQKKMWDSEIDKEVERKYFEIILLRPNEYHIDMLTDLNYMVGTLSISRNARRKRYTRIEKLG